MRRLLDRAWWHDSLVPLVAVAAVCLIAGAVAGAYFITSNINTGERNRDLICTLNRLFGLTHLHDNDVRVKALTAEQREALHELVAACPLGR